MFKLYFKNLSSYKNFDYPNHPQLWNSSDSWHSTVFRCWNSSKKFRFSCANKSLPKVGFYSRACFDVFRNVLLINVSTMHLRIFYFIKFASYILLILLFVHYFTSWMQTVIPCQKKSGIHTMWLLLHNVVFNKSHLKKFTMGLL